MLRLLLLQLALPVLLPLACLWTDACKLLKQLHSNLYLHTAAEESIKGGCVRVSRRGRG